MPYIPPEQRPKYEQSIRTIVENLLADSPDEAKGELNYVIYSVIQRYLHFRGMRYASAQDFIGGTLTCCQSELLRRLVNPYEDKAIEKNGDVEIPTDFNPPVKK